VPLGSKSLAFLIENSSNQNSSQLADNKQKRPVLIENFEPNRARLFAPSRAEQIAPTAVAQPQFAVFQTGLPRALFAKGSACANTFLPGSAQHVESVVTYSKQSTGELLPGSRIARLCSFSLRVCEKGRSTGVASWNTGRGPQSRCLNSLLLHLTNCRLSRLQLFPPAGVCNKRDMQEIPARADNVRVTHSEASFVVE
jgi:hypothetical protein